MSSFLGYLQPCLLLVQTSISRQIVWIFVQDLHIPDANIVYCANIDIALQLIRTSGDTQPELEGVRHSGSTNRFIRPFQRAMRHTSPSPSLLRVQLCHQTTIIGDGHVNNVKSIVLFLLFYHGCGYAHSIHTQRAHITRIFTRKQSSHYGSNNSGITQLQLASGFVPNNGTCHVA